MTTTYAPVDVSSSTAPCGCGHASRICDCEQESCELECLERPRFYCGLVLTDTHLTDLATWVQKKLSLRRFVDGWGVACGLGVRCDPANPGGVLVAPGYALSPCGEDILLCADVGIDLSGCCNVTDPCSTPDSAIEEGTKHLAGYHDVTPATVWDHYGLPPEQTAGLNAQMFCSFVDGTKSAVEMAAVSNATGLVPQARGLGFPPCGTAELAAQLRPAGEGGVLDRSSTLEVVSSLHPDGSPVAGDLRWGVYVTVAAGDRFVASAFAAYGLATSADGRVAALWRPAHLVGLELGVSVARAALAGEPTGSPVAAIAGVACCAKRDLRAGETIDGEGGEHVYGVLRSMSPALGARMLPMGLARGARVVRDITRGSEVAQQDVEIADRGSAAALYVDLIRELAAPAAHT